MSLARPTGPSIKLILEDLKGFTLEDKADLSCESTEVAGATQQQRIGLIEKSSLHVSMTKVTTMTIFIKPGHDAGPTRHTDRRRVVVVQEANTLFRELVEIGSDNILIPIAPHSTHGLIIGEQEHDIRSWARGLSG